MRKADLINSIEKRLPFRVAQRMLRDHGFPTGQTWVSIREKLAAGTARLKYHALNDAYVESLVASEKSVSAFNISSKKRTELIARLDVLSPDPDNHFVKKYPYVLDEKSLAKTEAAGTVFVGVKPLSFGVAVIFSTVRVTEHRERLPLTRLPSSLAKRFAEFYGIRKDYHQSYDAVILPSTGDHVWISVDCPLYSNEDYPDFAHIAVRKAFNELVGEEVLIDPINLFPLIAKLYSATGEGAVIALSHLVSTASVKHEKMRDGKCLRDELFHKAGSDAVKGNLAAFAIGVRWEESASGAEVELMIDGVSKDASKADPSVVQAIIRKCATSDGLDFGLKKILSLLATQV